MNVEDDALHDLASCFLSLFTCLSGEGEREGESERIERARERARERDVKVPCYVLHMQSVS